MKKLLVFLLSLTICFTPSLVFASGLNGWSLSNPIAQGASTLYNGAKNVLINGKNVAKTSTALITPTASQVAKVLARGAAGYALAEAVNQLLGAVDWVLDPVNNQIVYKVSDTSISSTPPDYREYFGIIDYYGYQNVYTTDLTNAAKISCTREGSLYGYTYVSHTISRMYVPGETGNVTALCNVKDSSNNQSKRSVSFNYYYVVSNPPKEESEENTKTIPLDAVATQVISNAESGNAAAQVATTAAAADVVNDAQNDSTKARPIVNELETNSKTETDEGGKGESKPKDPAKPESGSDFSLDFPVFCGWAPTICEAAITVITFPQTLTDWWDTSKQKTDSWAKSISDAYTSTKDWFQKEPEKNNEGTDVPVEIPTPFDTSIFSKDRFSVSRQCPVPEQHTISLSGISVNFAFDLKPICSVLELARPALIACSYLYACYIVIGAARNG